MAKTVRGPNGGKRPGAGRPKGTKNLSTITKEQAREALRQIVLREMDALVAAQLAHAKGISFLVVRDKKTGKFTRLTETRAKATLATDEEIVEIWEKDPSVQAFTDLMNRALDKPKEQEMEVKVTGSDELIAKLHAARARMARRNG